MLPTGMSNDNREDCDEDSEHSHAVNTVWVT